MSPKFSQFEIRNVSAGQPKPFFVIPNRTTICNNRQIKRIQLEKWGNIFGKRKRMESEKNKRVT